jgi:FMN-dependent NADH-azoreductase
MYNFNVPLLKAWIDHRPAEQDFSFDANGLKGLAAGKKVTVIITPAGSTPQARRSSPTTSKVGLTSASSLGFIGITGHHHRPCGGTNKVAQGQDHLSRSFSSSSSMRLISAASK